MQQGTRVWQAYSAVSRFLAVFHKIVGVYLGLQTNPEQAGRKRSVNKRGETFPRPSAIISAGFGQAEVEGPRPCVTGKTTKQGLNLTLTDDWRGLQPAAVFMSGRSYSRRSS